MATALPLLVLCITVSLNCVYGQDPQGTGYTATASFCCNTQQGPQVQVTPNNINDITGDSPNYEIMASPSFYNQGLDNICHTYFPMGNGTFVRISTLTFSNGTLVIQKYILGRLTPGIGRFQGLTIPSGASTIVYDEVFLGSPCPAVRVYYRKYIAGSCNVLEDEINTGIDCRHGDANTRGLSDYCASQVYAIANSQNFNGTQMVVYPYKLNSNCVTQFNGIKCINADRVRPQDAISLPYTGSSCQTSFYK